ncbi:MAG TPA: GTP cyclohydrolase IIa [Candidatus Nitrosocosmicus sp.]|nr:GTP cyclohydrolase IIa [Candidatus Nitrosocosmicus sp.]
MGCQLTIIRLEGYGPWTLELGSDREHQLQMLQARIYADLQSFFSDENGIVFFNRFDEYITISNQISLQRHKVIHEKLSKKYNQVKISMTIASGVTPLEADHKIQMIKKNREKYIAFPSIFASIENSSSEHEDNLKIIHIDVDSSTAIANELSSYEITNLLIKIHSMVSDVFLKEDSLTFFLGGDNFMIVAKNSIKMEKILKILENIKDVTGVKFNCGIGSGVNARTAVKLATKSLDQIRELRKNGKIMHVIESN